MRYQGCYSRNHLIKHKTQPPGPGSRSLPWERVGNSRRTLYGSKQFLDRLLSRAFRSLAGMFFVSALCAQVNVLTWHNDAARTGQNLQETILSPGNVSSANFGLLPFAPLATDGTVDAQPLYATGLVIAGGTHNVLYVATENDSLYAFDADTGAQLWMQSLLQSGETAVPAGNVGCTQVAPILGITSTPAIDMSSGPDGTIYLVAMSVSGSNYYQRLHALDLLTGAEESGWPIVVQATYPSSNGVVTFNPQLYKERAGLLISNGFVYTSWASHCDGGTYNGWIIGYNESTQAQVVLNLTPNGEKGAIWQSGAGPAADAGGDLYFLMANGYFDGTLNSTGFPADGDYGNAFMHLSTLAGLTVQDYFTSDNSPTEPGGQNDDDLGSGGTLLLPTLNDAMGNPHALAVGAGKDGIAYVVDRNNMGKYNGSNNAVYQTLALGGGVYSSPAWFNNTLYYGAVGQPLRAYPYSGGSFGSASSQSSVSFGSPGTTPSISGAGSTNGVVWAVSSSPSVLYAYDASNLNELYDSTQAGNRDSFGTAISFPTPTVANGKVYVGTTTGVAVFGMLNCTYSNGPIYGTVAVDSTAHIGGFSIPASPNTCSWSVVNDSNFITITSATSGTGTGSVLWSIPANPGAARTGAIVYGGQTAVITQAGATSTSGLAFYPLTPCRIVDTRAGFGFEGAFGAPSLVEGATRSFPIPNSFCGVQPTQAYSLNVTAVQDASLVYMTAFPAGLMTPNVSTLNAPQGNVVANAAILTGGTDSGVSVFASNNTGVLIDINGYFAPPTAPQGLAFYPMSPCRVADTREYFGFMGDFGPPSLVGGAARNFPMQQSSCDIPSSALAYSVRMTAVADDGPLGYLTTWPMNETLPNVSTLNAPLGGVVGNQAIVPAGTDSAGSLSVFVSDATDLLIDINGYFGPPGGSGALYFYPVTPCRIADTRQYFGFTGAFGPPSLIAGASRTFPIQSACGIPSSAQAYSLNLTAVVPSGGDLVYLTAFPTGVTVPNASTLNAPMGGVVASAAIVPAGTGGSIDVFSSDATDLLIDINGYFAP